MTVKGVEYAVFPAASGGYVANYLLDTRRRRRVTSRTPAAGATGVRPSTPIRATFSESMDSSTINSTTFEVRDAATALVPGTVEPAARAR